MEIVRMRPGDEARVTDADYLYDNPAHPEATRAFLALDSNYLLIAYEEGEPAGFITGHRLERLDTPHPMMFLYEIGVDKRFQGRGIGTALVRELASIAEAEGFLEMYVLTNEGNPAAMRMYARAGGERHSDRDIAMFEWEWCGR